MPTFVGTWNTTRYRNPDAVNPETIELIITEDSNVDSLDGHYARPGMDARLLGTLDPAHMIWTATLDEVGSSGDTGSAVFFLSADGNTLHGAWTSVQTGNGPQPWFGHRVP